MGQERGQSLVEIALILPIILLMLAITFDIGRAMTAYMDVVHAAREASWVASQPYGTVGAAQNAARAALADAGLDPARAAVTVVIRPTGQPVEATVSYVYDPLMPILPVGPITIRARNTAVRW